MIRPERVVLRRLRVLISKPANRAIRSDLRSLSTVCGDRCAACAAHALPHGARSAALAAIARTTVGASSTATKLSVLMRCSANSFASAYLWYLDFRGRADVQQLVRELTPSAHRCAYPHQNHHFPPWRTR